jgi:small subunit ribosomal protein S8e
MTEWKHKSKRKISGGMRTTRRARDKRLYEKGGVFSETKIGEPKSKTVKGVGSTSKVKLQKTKYANVVDPKTKKTQKMEVVNVKVNEANRVYARRQIMTKGALIELGKEKIMARVTSRPGQSGVVNAILVEAKDLPQAKAKQRA